ncbi:hypothetical protein [Burkholderia anthina]|uniref:hypothetical protein n=1 Tax=Burkholderia anthina TaxID=179879 RepID=UPI0037C0FE40
MHALDRDGRFAGTVTVVPYANPIGLSQRLFGLVVGRFDFENGENFNRNFPLPGTAPGMHVAWLCAHAHRACRWRGCTCPSCSPGNASR